MSAVRISWIFVLDFVSQHKNPVSVYIKSTFALIFFLLIFYSTDICRLRRVVAVSSSLFGPADLDSKLNSIHGEVNGAF